MTATCTYENIKKALRAVEGMVGKDLGIPIIKNILIEAHDNTLAFSATNLEIGVVQKVPARTKEDWKIVVAPNLLSGLLNALRGGEHVILEKEGLNLKIKSGSYENVISGLDAEDFPIIPLSDTSQGTVLDLAILKQGISSVLPFVTHNEIRPELTGVFMKVEEEVLHLAATDSFRLGEKKVLIKDLSKKTRTFPIESLILPQKFSSYIVRLSDDIEEVTWIVDENHLSVVCDQLYITTRLIDGNYPQYDQIIPTKTETNIIIKKEDLLESMRVMIVFSQKDVNEIVFESLEEELIIATRKQEFGASETTLAASISGDTKRVVMNPRYIYEGIQHIAESEIFIGINNAAAPIVIRGSNEDGVNTDYTYIVMPIKSKE